MPEIAHVLESLPPTTIEDMRKWEVHKWCREDPDWRAALFGKQSMSVFGIGGGLPVNGLLPSSLQKLALLIGSDLALCDE